MISTFQYIFYRFSDVQDKAMIGMKVIPSVFLQEVNTMEPNRMANHFEYFLDNLPHHGTFDAELLQWLVS